MELFLCSIGMVMIVEGLPHFAFPEKMKSYMRQFSEMPEAVLRRIGFVLMLSGLFTVYVARSFI